MTWHTRVARVNCLKHKVGVMQSARNACADEAHQIKQEVSVMEMTLLKFFLDKGLLTDKDNKIGEVKKLTQEDRAWFRERALIEYGITIVQPANA